MSCISPPTPRRRLAVVELGEQSLRARQDGAALRVAAFLQRLIAGRSEISPRRPARRGIRQIDSALAELEAAVETQAKELKRAFRWIGAFEQSLTDFEERITEPCGPS